MTNELKNQDYYNNGIETKKYTNSHNFNFNLGSVIKYITRCNYKGDKRKDLIKARNYIDYEMERCGYSLSDKVNEMISDE